MADRCRTCGKALYNGPDDYDTHCSWCMARGLDLIDDDGTRHGDRRRDVAARSFRMERDKYGPA